MTITYDIELHDITELTWPMWEACSVECPAMIGGTCGRATYNKDGKWTPCPGWSAKFSNAAAEVVHSWTLDSFQSEECGNATDGPAWFALFPNHDTHRQHHDPLGAGVILCVLSTGAVQATRFESGEELTRDWAKIEAEAYDDNDEDEEG